MRRQTAEQIMASLNLPEVVSSLDQAKRDAGALMRANERLNTLHYEATSEQYHPDGVLPPEPYAPGELEAREIGLRRVHGLQAQAMIWRLAEIFEAIPMWDGFRYEQKDSREAPHRHATTVTHALKRGHWRSISLGSESDHEIAATIKDFLDALPDLLVYAAAEVKWERPTRGESLIHGLMSQARGAMGPEAFSAWEAHSLSSGLMTLCCESPARPALRV